MVRTETSNRPASTLAAIVLPSLSSSRMAKPRSILVMLRSLTS